MSTPTHVPNVVFRTRVRDESIGGENPYRWQDVTSEELFKDKKIVFFALPGAFTPTCSDSHLPGYEKRYDDFKALGIDDVICLAVNDAFVMFQWAKKLGVEHIRMIPDGNCEFTKELGMLVQKHNLGYGARSWRYSMYVDDTEIKKMFVEPGQMDNCENDPFEVSDAETMYTYLKGLSKAE